MKDIWDKYLTEAEILELLEFIVSERKRISDVEIQQENDRVMQAIKRG